MICLSSLFSETPPRHNNKLLLPNLKQKTQALCLRAVVIKKFSEHPYRVCEKPEHHGKVMQQFNFRIAVKPCDIYGKCHSRENHNYSKSFRQGAPAKVFNKPQHDVKVFEVAEAHKFFHNYLILLWSKYKLLFRTCKPD